MASNYWGMHLAWWFIWGSLVFWIFATPYDIPGQKRKSESPLDILRKRYAAGQMTTDDYQERKKVLDNELVRSE
jgi:putative membrane protein